MKSTGNSCSSSICIDSIRDKWGVFRKYPQLFLGKTKVGIRLRTPVGDQHIQYLSQKIANLDVAIQGNICDSAGVFAGRVAEYSQFCVMIDQMVQLYERHQIEPGTNIGVFSVQSFSERLTQATLNSFHLSGTKDSPVVGVQAVIDMLHYSKNPHNTILYPLPGKLHRKMLKEVIRERKYDVIDGMWKMWLKTEYYAHFGKIWDRLRHKSKVGYQQDHGEFVITLVSGSDDDHVIHLINEWVLGLEEMVKHEDGVVKVYRPNKLDMLDFNDILNCLDMKDADALLGVRTNKLAFIYNNLGVEATRTYMVDTILAILSKEGIDINVAHVELMVDNMCQSGQILPYTRYGIDTEAGVLLRATFETPYQTFCEASSKKYEDDISGVSASILMGKSAQIGTMYNIDVNIGSVVEHDTQEELPESQHQELEEFDYFTTTGTDVTQANTFSDIHDTYVPCSPEPLYEQDEPSPKKIRHDVTDTFLEMDLSF